MSGRFTNFTLKSNTTAIDILRIKSNRITGHLNAVRFRDADTNQYVCYLSALEVSGYGDTYEKAVEMAKFSASQFFDYLLSLSSKKRKQELAEAGWKHGNFLKNKDFSKAYVDVDGELRELNAVEGTIERLTLEAA